MNRDCPHASIPAGDSLTALAARINENLEKGDRTTRKGVEFYRQAGQQLIEAKELIGHGGWLAWVAKNVKCSESRCRHYMQLARAAKSIVTTDLDLDRVWQVISGNAPEEIEEEDEEEDEDFEASEGGEEDTDADALADALRADDLAVDAGLKPDQQLAVVAASEKQIGRTAAREARKEHIVAALRCFRKGRKWLLREGDDLAEEVALADELIARLEGVE